MDLAERTDIDGDELSRLLETLRQGDVLEIARLVTLWSPDVPSFPEEVEGVAASDPVATIEALLPSGRCVIVSQDCDLRRSPELEPYVVVAPLRSVTDEERTRARPGLSSRLYAYPDIGTGDHERNLVVDMRVVQSIEKLALLSPHVVRHACPLGEPSRHDFRDWLGRRLGRVAFPDDVQRQVVDKLSAVLGKVAKKPPSDRTVECIAFVGLQWTPGRRPCHVLLLLDPWKRGAHKVGDDEVRAFRRALERGLVAATRNGEYDVRVVVHDANLVSAADLLRFHELVPELV